MPLESGDIIAAMYPISVLMLSKRSSADRNYQCIARSRKPGETRTLAFGTFSFAVPIEMERSRVEGQRRGAKAELVLRRLISSKRDASRG